MYGRPIPDACTCGLGTVACDSHYPCCEHCNHHADRGTE